MSDEPWGLALLLELLSEAPAFPRGSRGHAVSGAGNGDPAAFSLGSRALLSSGPSIPSRYVCPFSTCCHPVFQETVVIFSLPFLGIHFLPTERDSWKPEGGKWCPQILLSIVSPPRLREALSKG